MDSSRPDQPHGTAGWNEPAPVNQKDPGSAAEPPDLLLSALVALLFVVAAVCLLAVTQSTWALIVAVATMAAGTLQLALVIALELDQDERPR